MRGASRPASQSLKHTSARTLREAHRCQDPAWGAPPSPPRASPPPSLSPSSALRPRSLSQYPLSAASRARLARTPLSPSLRRVLGLAHPPAAPFPRAPAAAALALPAGPAEAACALCQRAPREPVRADCGHRFCRSCVVRFWAEEDGPFPCPECADDCWQRAVEPGRPPLSRRLLALEEAAAAPARDGPASEAALQLLCRADGGPLCAACRMAAGPEPPEWEPRWRKALRGKVRAGGDLYAARPHPQPGPRPQTVPCTPSPCLSWCPVPHPQPLDRTLSSLPRSRLVSCPPSPTRVPAPGQRAQSSIPSSPLSDSSLSSLTRVPFPGPCLVPPHPSLDCALSSVIICQTVPCPPPPHPLDSAQCPLP